MATPRYLPRSSSRFRYLGEPDAPLSCACDRAARVLEEVDRAGRGDGRGQPSTVDANPMLDFTNLEVGIRFASAGPRSRSHQTGDGLRRGCARAADVGAADVHDAHWRDRGVSSV